MRKPPPALRDQFPPNLDYAYFAGRGEPRLALRPRRDAPFDLVTASWMADAALLAYADPEFARARFAEAGLEAELFAAGSTQCYVARRDPDVVLVVFRGTRVYRGGAASVDGALAELRQVALDVATDLRIPLVDAGEGRCVHRGFCEGLDAVWKGTGLRERLEELRREAGRDFWFAGHSLGAALATLAADRFGAAAALYTFGSPLVGDEAFGRRFAVPALRFVHGDDVITRVPVAAPRAAGSLRAGLGLYRHVGESRYLRGGRLLPEDARAGAALLEHVASDVALLRDAIAGRVLRLPNGYFCDHAPVNYATALWNLCV